MPNGTTETETPNNSTEGDDIEARIARLVDAKLNGAITNHLRRVTDQLPATIEKSVASVLEKRAGAQPAQQATQQEQQGQPQKADPQLVKLQEQLEKLQKDRDGERAARLETERKASRSDAHRTLTSALEAKGVKGARARAVVADLEQSGQLRWTEDGRPELVVKRGRVKGAKPEELVFEDLAEGVEDWSKTTDAAEFLPAPVAAPAARRSTTTASNPAANGSKPQTLDTDDDIVNAVMGELEKR